MAENKLADMHKFRNPVSPFSAPDPFMTFDPITGYYYARDTVPPRITVDGDVNDIELLQEWLSKKLGKKVSIVKPQKGDQLKLVEMCKNNAAEHLAHLRGNVGKDTMALNMLGELLGLKALPRYIESYDISNQNGTANVCGMVVFEDGKLSHIEENISDERFYNVLNEEFFINYKK